MTSPWPESHDPSQPAFPPPAQPPKKKRRGLIVGAIIGGLLLLAVCCGGGVTGYLFWEEEQDWKKLYATYDEIPPPTGFTATKAKEVDGVFMVKGTYSLEGWKPGGETNPVDATMAWYQKVSGRTMTEYSLTSHCYGKNTGGCSEQFTIGDQRLTAYFRAVHTSSSISFYIELSVQPPISD